ncbi:MAG TPA: hypothetical protein VFP36_14115 [Usitatibacter sp.]|nr:hypothetical protein [Usitatibacter sp.]
MPKKTPVFNPALEPITQPLPETIAASIGRTIARHSYMEWVLGQVLYSLLEISIKQGRAVVQRPQPRQYVASIQGLCAFQKIDCKFDFDGLTHRVEAADRARDALVHSVYMRDIGTDSDRVFLVHGSWARPNEAEVIRTGEWPDTPVLDRAFLSNARKMMDDAVKSAEELQALVGALLRQLHELRRTNPKYNRRRSDRA